MSHSVVTFLILCYVSWSYAREKCESPQCDVHIRIDTGWVCGALRHAAGDELYASFRGVPYAKPPLGARRFKELEPRDPWHGVFDATEESPACPQKDLLYGRLALHKHGQSEDCIYLNLHVSYHALPKADFRSTHTEDKRMAKKGLPILVMIHGGAFLAGSGLTDLHGPEYLIPRKVIVITFNYRLNVFGFLSLRSKEIPGNQGLRDQVTLLRWVQRNAKAFGGDPDNVTIMGQSAGAVCAHMLSMSKVTYGLFKRIILMSGTAIPSFYSASPNYAKQVADDFISYMYINTTDPIIVHQLLTHMPLHRIMQAFTNIQHKYGSTVFVPVIEGEYSNIMRVLDKDPLKLIAEGRGKHYPAIIGFTSNELEAFRWMFTIQNAVKLVQESPIALLFPNRVYDLPQKDSMQLAHKVYKWCFNGNVSLDKLLECQGVMQFKYGALKLAGWRAITGAPTYLYEFSYESPFSVIKQGLWAEYPGAAHIEDLTYIFKATSILGEEESFALDSRDESMKNWMTKLFTNFMRCSSPTCNSDNSWPAVSLNRLIYQNIQEPNEYRPVAVGGEEALAVKFLDNITSTQYAHLSFE